MQTPVRLTLRATDLPNIAGVFKVSDPYASVSLRIDGEDEIIELGNTEVLKNTLDPEWTSSFTFLFQLGKPASIMVKIFDKDSKAARDEYMCGTVFSVGAVVGSRGNTLGKKMKGGGTLIAFIEKEESDALFIFQLRAIDLKNVENSVFSKSDPFFEVAKKGIDSEEWVTIYRSESVKKNLNPLWNSGKIDLDLMCSNDVNASLRLVVFDNESDGDHILIGSLHASVNELIAAKKFGGGDADRNEASLTLFDSDDNFAGLINVIQARIIGKVTVLNAKNVTESEEVDVINEDESNTEETEEKLSPEVPGFIDFLSGGCELSLCIAIDFTGSNGDPTIPETLHYMSPDGVLNKYEEAIVKIGSILANFDSDKHFPVWGFGAKLGDEVCHAFALSDGQAHGIDGVLESYRSCFKTGFIMSGPTDITQILRVAARRACKLQENTGPNEGLNYSVCLILTDGAVHNVQETIDVLYEISDAPLSVIIVGIGNEDFTGMQFLEDIGKATFVPLRDHVTNLTEETLEKLPEELVEYFLSRDIYPPAMIATSTEEIVIYDYSEKDDIKV